MLLPVVAPARAYAVSLPGILGLNEELWACSSVECVIEGVAVDRDLAALCGCSELLFGEDSIFAQNGSGHVRLIDALEIAIGRTVPAGQKIRLTVLQTTLKSLIIPTIAWQVREVLSSGERGCDESGG